MNISAKVDDTATRRALHSVAAHARADAADAVRGAVDRSLPAIRTRVPKQSGEYAASIDAGGTGRGAYVKARRPYATVLERGRAPMVIRAIGAAMTTPGGPRRSVDSPRYPARRVLRKAVFAQSTQIADDVERDVLRRVAARL